MSTNTIRAGRANLFLSDVFCETLASVSGATIELFDTDGALGAARGAGVGAGIFNSPVAAFSSLERIGIVEPVAGEHDEAFHSWEAHLNNVLIE